MEMGRTKHLTTPLGQPQWALQKSSEKNLHRWKNIQHQVAPYFRLDSSGDSFFQMIRYVEPRMNGVTCIHVWICMILCMDIS